jgi:RNA polymerase sporulation-specific sigma factor
LTHDPEAESIGFEALLNAINTFDDQKNVKFSTYATVCIYNALGSYIRELNKKRQLEVISYNSLVYEEAELVDFIPGPCSAEDDYVGNEYCKYIRKILADEHAKLHNHTVWNVVDIWITSEFTKDTKEIAKEAGVSQSYVSQILNRFRYSLKKRLEEYNA